MPKVNKKKDYKETKDPQKLKVTTNKRLSGINRNLEIKRS